ncbi:MAG TPA: acetolactate synthase small subunit [Spirochaetales bacterium]|nr:acetolactate synthase small subunit [Spirochaetales bacterium]HRY55319.1 acetolactate synthase small subunit [Spirochaetia bacterium]HRZ64326.1 acetolactate synthase small subunit [Spirochaetia bacterium]
MRDEASGARRVESTAIVSALVRDHAGVLVRVAELFSRRGYNIDGLTVGPCPEPGLSRMTISLRCPEEELDQVQRQLEKLVDVVAVRRLPAAQAVARELALVKVSAGAAERAEVIQVAEVFRARVVDVSPETLVLEVTGDAEKVDGLVELLAPYGIREMARTGLSALGRGASSLNLS